MVKVAGMYLRDLLQAKGVLSAADFGRQMGISRQHAWLLWTGKSLPSQDTLQQLRLTFGLDPNDLINLTREAPSKQGKRRRRGKGGQR
jgi:transcriptional regulator with XRE-family HTH domain